MNGYATKMRTQHSRRDLVEDFLLFGIVVDVDVHTVSDPSERCTSAGSIDSAFIRFEKNLMHKS